MSKGVVYSVTKPLAQDPSNPLVTAYSPHPANPAPQRFLFRLYHPTYWYLPVADIYRRLVLTSVLRIVEDPMVQLLVALTVSMGFLIVFREW